MPNRPYLDASVQWRINSGQLSLEEPDYRSVVDAILSAGLATEVVGLISAGKEANVYLVRYIAVGPAHGSADGLGERTRRPSDVFPPLRSPDRRRGLCKRTR